MGAVLIIFDIPRLCLDLCARAKASAEVESLTAPLTHALVVIITSPACYGDIVVIKDLHVASSGPI